MKQYSSKVNSRENEEKRGGAALGTFDGRGTLVAEIQDPPQDDEGSSKAQQEGIMHDELKNGWEIVLTVGALRLVGKPGSFMTQYLSDNEWKTGGGSMWSTLPYALRQFADILDQEERGKRTNYDTR